MRKTTRILMAVLLPVVVAGCARSALDPVADEQPLERKRWQVEIEAHDGTLIAATVWQPQLAAGESAPLMLHTHGFGLQRMDGRFGLYENFLYTGQVAKQMWKDGAWLITWDQRGHGDTKDKINLMEPDKEIRDVSTIIDWAEQNLARLARDNGDPRIGMIGESYGGAVQMMASVKDSRIDAVVPVTTWYDLDLALAPGDVPKGGWMTVLYMMGDWVNFRKLPENLRAAFGDAKDGFINPEAKEYLSDNQMRHFCDQGQYPNADALIISGLRDVLFNPLQGIGAQACFEAAGREANLVVNRDGHLLPSKQFSNELPGWALDNKLYCGDEPLSTEVLATEWLKSKLMDADAPAVPRVCISVDKWGIALNQWPQQGQMLELPSVSLKGNGSGRWEWANLPADFFAGLRTEKHLSQKFADGKDGAWRPAFMPLVTADAETHYVGTPVLDLKAEEDGIAVLAAIVHRKKGSADLDIVHQQVVPVRTGTPAAMPPVAIAVKPGDQLGLMLLSRHGQFNTLNMEFGDGVTFNGRIQFPLTADALSSQETAVSQR